MMERGYTRFLPLVFLAVLVGVVISQLRRRRRLRSFREDPIGALKDRSELVADKAQLATEEALTRIQDSLDELRGRLPELNRRKKERGIERQRRELNKRLVGLNNQAQALVRDVRGSGVFNR